MLVIFILLSIIAVLIIIANPKSPSNWWGSFFALLVGFGGLGEFLNERFIINSLDPGLKGHAIYWLITVLSLLYGYFSPYALTMFIIYYSDIFSGLWRKILTLILSSPILIMFYLYPADIFISSKSYLPGFRALLGLWATFYILAANLILLYSFWREEKEKARRQKLYACIIIVPSTILWLLTTYMPVLLNIRDAWKYNPLIAGYAFIAFIGVIISDGFMGLRIRIEREYLENTMKATCPGTAILNHTIKNEMANIMICMHNIQHRLGDINTNIEIVLNALAHFQALTDRINIHTRDIIINEEYSSLPEIINQSLDSLNFALQDKKIEVIKNFSDEIHLFCDKIHLRETFNNLFKNAIEAMGPMGKLEIGILRKRRWIVITIKDNGEGISKKNLPLVLTPFFTTRKSGNNFGLGLSYSYNAIQKHGGKIELESEKGAGTTVSIYLPASKIGKN